MKDVHSVEDVHRFWSKVQLAGDDDCWLWMAAKNQFGYGTILWEGKPRKAHRVSYFLEHGKFDPKLDVCHTCDNPACVNPKHLFLGTAQVNIDDMMRKGRQRSGTQRLTPAQVEEIRAKHRAAQGKYGTLARLGREYGVTRNCIWMVVHEYNWNKE